MSATEGLKTSALENGEEGDTPLYDRANALESLRASWSGTTNACCPVVVGTCRRNFAAQTGLNAGHARKANFRSTASLPRWPILIGLLQSTSGVQSAARSAPQSPQLRRKGKCRNPRRPGFERYPGFECYEVSVWRFSQQQMPIERRPRNAVRIHAPIPRLWLRG